MRILLTAAAMVAASASASLAISVQVTGFDLASATAAKDAFINGKIVSQTEDFEGFNDGDAGASIATAIGTFSTDASQTIGGLGLRIDDGRDGRTNTTPGGSLYLDSFDAQVVTLDLNLSPLATGLGFFMSDVDDQGGDTFMEVFAGGTSLWNQALIPGTGARPSGEVMFVGIDFGGAMVDQLVFTVNDTVNPINQDGIGFDDFHVTAVPLPAAGWMLIAGVGALFGFGRRKAAA
jgi:hypothetical protein